jgi:hypothetical protein
MPLTREADFGPFSAAFQLFMAFAPDRFPAGVFGQQQLSQRNRL